MQRKSISIIAVLIASTFLFTACDEKKQADLNAAFTFVKGQVTVNGEMASVGQKVKEADTVIVKPESGAILQFAGDAVLTLSEDTVLQLSKLSRGSDGKPSINMAQSKGSTFSKVLTKGADYRVSTQTLVAGVRGTSFSVSVDKNNPDNISVKLLKGKVAVSPPSDKEAESASQSAANAEPVVLNEGEKISANKKEIRKTEKMTSREKEIMTRADESIYMIPAEKLAKAEDVQAETAVIMTEEKTAEVTRMISEELPEAVAVDKPEEAATTGRSAPARKKKMTIDDLRAKYGALSKVETKDGKSYIGPFRTEGKYLVITTVNGEVKVPSVNVAKVSRY